MNDKKIIDFLHLYLGCDVRVKRKRDTEFLTGRMCEVTRKSNHGDWIEVRFDDVVAVTGRTSYEPSYSNFHNFFFGEDHIQPILRPLSDMTKEESFRWKQMVKSYQSYAATVKYFLDRHFDLFQLIEAGLAIDKTKL